MSLEECWKDKYRCPFCNNIIVMLSYMKFCPNCGKKLNKYEFESVDNLKWKKQKKEF